MWQRLRSWDTTMATHTSERVRRHSMEDCIWDTGFKIQPAHTLWPCQWKSPWPKDMTSLLMGVYCSVSCWNEVAHARKTGTILAETSSSVIWQARASTPGLSLILLHCLVLRRTATIRTRQMYSMSQDYWKTRVVSGVLWQGEVCTNADEMQMVSTITWRRFISTVIENHCLTFTCSVEEEGHPAIDGLVAVLTVKITDRPAS